MARLFLIFTQARSQEEWNAIRTLNQRMQGNLQRLNPLQGNENSPAQKLFQSKVDLTGFADGFLQGHADIFEDRVTISQEGMDYVRNQLKEMGHVTTKESFMGVSEEDWHIYTHLDVNSEDIEADLVGLYNKMIGGSHTNHREEDAIAEALTYAYETLRDAIVKGYEDGTREVWTTTESLDEAAGTVKINVNGTELDCRKLTVEEELAKLNEIFDEFTDCAVNAHISDLEMYDQQRYIRMLTYKYDAEWAAQRARERGIEIPGLDGEFFDRIERCLERLKEIMDRDRNDAMEIWTQQMQVLKETLKQTSVLPQLAENTVNVNGNFGQAAMTKSYLSKAGQQFGL